MPPRPAIEKTALPRFSRHTVTDPEDRTSPAGDEFDRDTPLTEEKEKRAKNVARKPPLLRSYYDNSKAESLTWARMNS